jgi:glycosyltransferase involved in cell wall biosynthesis
LESVAWADEIVVVDSGSTDGTESVCREFTERFIYHEWESSNRQKQFALEQCKCPWVLSIDADEVVSPGMRKSIESLLSGEPQCRGYKILRRNYYKDILLDFGAMHAKPELRMFRRDSGKFADRAVHDKVIIDGKVGWLKGYIEHYNISELAEWVEKNVRYARLSGEDDVAKGRRVTWRHFCGLPALFLRRYILWRGFLHGVLGLFFSAMPVYFRLLQYSVMWEKQKEAERRR